jgi:hypothetical protein
MQLEEGLQFALGLRCSLGVAYRLDNHQGIIYYLDPSNKLLLRHGEEEQRQQHEA